MKKTIFILIFIFLFQTLIFTPILNAQKLKKEILQNKVKQLYPKTKKDFIKLLLDTKWQIKIINTFPVSSLSNLLLDYFKNGLIPPKYLMLGLGLKGLATFIQTALNYIKDTLYSLKDIPHASWGYIWELFQGSVLVVGEKLVVSPLLGSFMPFFGNVAVFITMDYINKIISQKEKSTPIDAISYPPQQVFYVIPETISKDLDIMVNGEGDNKSLNSFILETVGQWDRVEEWIDNTFQNLVQKQRDRLNYLDKVSENLKKAIEKTTNKPGMKEVFQNRNKYLIKLKRINMEKRKLLSLNFQLKKYKKSLQEFKLLKKEFKKTAFSFSNEIKDFFHKKHVTVLGDNFVLSLSKSDALVARLKGLGKLEKLSSHTIKELSQLNNTFTWAQIRFSPNRYLDFVDNIYKIRKKIYRLERLKNFCTTAAHKIKEEFPTILDLTLSTISLLDANPPSISSGLIEDNLEGKLPINYIHRGKLNNFLLLQDKGSGLNLKTLELLVNSKKIHFNHYQDEKEGGLKIKKEYNFFQIDEKKAERYKYLEDRFSRVLARFEIPIKEKIIDLKAKIRDRAGHLSKLYQLKTKLVEDKTPPEIKILFPSPYQELKENKNYQFKVAFEEDKSFLDWRKIKINLLSKGNIAQNNKNLPVKKNMFSQTKFLGPKSQFSFFKKGTMLFSFPSKLKKGIYTLQISAINLAGLKTATQLSFLVGKQNPLVFIPKFNPELMTYSPDSEILFGYTILKKIDNLPVEKITFQYTSTDSKFQKAISVTPSKITIPCENKKIEMLEKKPFKLKIDKKAPSGEAILRFIAKIKYRNRKDEISLPLQLKLQIEGNSKNFHHYLETYISFETPTGEILPLPRGTKVGVTQVYKLPTLGIPKLIEQQIGTGYVLDNNGFVRVSINPVYPTRQKRLRIYAEGMLYDFFSTTTGKKKRKLVLVVAPRKRIPYRFISKCFKVKPYLNTATHSYINTYPQITIPYHQPGNKGILIPWEGIFSTGGYINFSPFITQSYSPMGGGLNLGQQLLQGVNTIPGVYFHNINEALVILNHLSKIYQKAKKLSYLSSQLPLWNSNRFLPIITEEGKLTTSTLNHLPPVKEISNTKPETEENDEELWQKIIAKQCALSQKIISQIDKKAIKKDIELLKKDIETSSLVKIAFTFPKEGIVQEYLFNGESLFLNKTIKENISTPLSIDYLSQDKWLVLEKNGKIKILSARDGSLLEEYSSSNQWKKGRGTFSGQLALLDKKGNFYLTIPGEKLSVLTSEIEDFSLNMDKTKIYLKTKAGKILIKDELEDNFSSLPLPSNYQKENLYLSPSGEIYYQTKTTFLVYNPLTKSWEKTKWKKHPSQFTSLITPFWGKYQLFFQKKKIFLKNTLIHQFETSPPSSLSYYFSLSPSPLSSHAKIPIKPLPTTQNLTPPLPQKIVTHFEKKTETISKGELEVWTENLENDFQLEQDSPRISLAIPGIFVLYKRPKDTKTTYFGYTNKLKQPTIFVRGGQKDPDWNDPSILARAYSQFLRYRLDLRPGTKNHCYLSSNYENAPYLFKKRREELSQFKRLQLALEHGYDLFFSCYLRGEPILENTDGKISLSYLDLEKDILEPLTSKLKDEGIESLTEDNHLRGLDNETAIAALMWHLYQKYGELFIANLLAYGRKYGKLMDVSEMLNLFRVQTPTFIALGLTPVMLIKGAMDQNNNFISNSITVKVLDNGILKDKMDLSPSLIYDKSPQFNSPHYIALEIGKPFSFGKIIGNDLKIITSLKHTLQNGTYYFKVALQGVSWPIESGLTKIKVKFPVHTIKNEQGGNLTLNDKGNGPQLNLKIPPHSFPRKELPVTAQKIEFASEPSFLEVAGKSAYDLSPDGTHFNKPVKISFTFKKEELQKFDREELTVYKFDKTTNSFLPLTTKVDKNTVSAYTYTFSTYLVGVDKRPGRFLKGHFDLPLWNWKFQAKNYFSFFTTKYLKGEWKLVKEDNQKELLSGNFEGKGKITLKLVATPQFKAGKYLLKLKGYDKSGRLAYPAEFPLWISSKLKEIKGYLKTDYPYPLSISLDNQKLGETNWDHTFSVFIPQEANSFTLKGDKFFTQKLTLSDSHYLTLETDNNILQLNTPLPNIIKVSPTKTVVFNFKTKQKGLYKLFLKDKNNKIYYLSPFQTFSPQIQPLLEFDGKDYQGNKIPSASYKLGAEIISYLDLAEYFQKLGRKIEFQKAWENNSFSLLKEYLKTPQAKDFLANHSIQLFPQKQQFFLDQGLIKKAFLLPSIIANPAINIFPSATLYLQTTHRGKITISILNKDKTQLTTVIRNYPIEKNGKYQIKFTDEANLFAQFSDGNYYLEIKGVYLPEKIESKKKTLIPFLLDTKLPEWEKLSPSNGAKLKNPTPIFKAYPLSQISEIDLGEVYFKIDEYTIRPDGYMSSENCFYYQPKTSLGFGPHIVIAYMRDYAKNPAAPLSTYFIINKPKDLKDKEPPQAKITSPKIFYNSTPAFRGQLQDLLSGIDENSVQILIDNKNLPVKIKKIIPGKSGKKWDKYYYYQALFLYNPLEGTFSYRPLQPLKKGTHLFKIKFADKAGNQAEKDFYFSIKKDLYPPIITPQFKENSLLIIPNRNNYLSFQIKDKGESLLWKNSLLITLDGKKEGIKSFKWKKIDSQTWELKIYLENYLKGERLLAISIKDKALNKASYQKIITFKHDLLPPQIKLLVTEKECEKLRRKGIYSSKTLIYQKNLGNLISGETRPLFKIFLKDNQKLKNATIQIDNQLFSLPLSKLKNNYLEYKIPVELTPSLHQIRITAQDSSSNISSFSFQILIKRDIIPPKPVWKIKEKRYLTINNPERENWKLFIFIDGIKLYQNLKPGSTTIDLKPYFNFKEKHFLSFYVLDKAQNCSTIFRKKF